MPVSTAQNPTRLAQAPFGLQGDAKRSLVRRLFSDIADRYDWFNRLSSLGMDQAWRKAALRRAGLKAGHRVLDVCTGTGDLAFLAARYLLRDWVEGKFGDRIEPIQAGFAKNAFSYLMTLRLIPAFPFFLVNLVSGLTRVNLGTYVFATSIGIIPGSFVFAFAGRQLGSINSLGEIASPPVLMAFTLLGLLALMPIVYRKFVEKKNS